MVGEALTKQLVLKRMIENNVVGTVEETESNSGGRVLRRKNEKYVGRVPVDRLSPSKPGKYHGLPTLRGKRKAHSELLHILALSGRYHGQLQSM